MTRFGDQPIPDQLGPEEGWRLVVPNTAMPASGGLSVTIGAPYTMPFAGRLIADMKARAVWTVDQTYWRANLGASSPSPSSRTDHAHWTGLPGGFATYSEIPLTAQWFLTKGAVVTFAAGIATGSLGGMTIVAVGGFFRATPT